MNLFDVSNLTLFVISVASGIFVYTSRRDSKVNKNWFLFSIALGFWALTLYGVTSSSSAHTAMRWQYILDICAVYIPYLYTSYVLAFLHKEKPILKKILFVASTFLVVFSFTPLFKVGVTQIFDFYWIDPGALYFLFPLYFAVFIGYAIYLLFQTYISRRDINDEYTSQVKYQLYAGIVGFVGGASTFFPQLFNVFPVGNYFTSFYILFVSYAIYKHHLFSAKLITVEILSFIISILFLLKVFLSTGVEQIFNIVMFLFIVGFSVLLVRGVVTDINKRERIEQLSNDLFVANEQLRQMDKQKSDFVSIASHQLRTPLTAIKGYASLLLEDSFGKLPNKSVEPIKKIFESSQRMVMIVENFLTVSRIERGRMFYKFEVLDIQKIVSGLVRDMRPIAEGYGLYIRFNMDTSISYNVRADIIKIKQVVHNLLDESIKHTDKGFIEVSISQSLNGKHILLSISDTGQGASLSKLKQMFERHDPDIKSGEMRKETGFELYIAREIIRAHRGKIWAESEGVNRGLTFFVELELANINSKQS